MTLKKRWWGSSLLHAVVSVVEWLLTFIWKVFNHSSKTWMPHPRRPEPSATLLWEPQIMKLWWFIIGLFINYQLFAWVFMSSIRCNCNIALDWNMLYRSSVNFCVHLSLNIHYSSIPMSSHIKESYNFLILIQKYITLTLI